jgi:hypothetical protein
LPEVNAEPLQIDFGCVTYMGPKTDFVYLKNVGQVEMNLYLTVYQSEHSKKVIVKYIFIPKVDDSVICKGFLWVNPPQGLLLPGTYTVSKGIMKGKLKSRIRGGNKNSNQLTNRR